MPGRVYEKAGAVMAGTRIEGRRHYTPAPGWEPVLRRRRTPENPVDLPRLEWGAAIYMGRGEKKVWEAFYEVPEFRHLIDGRQNPALYNFIRKIAKAGLLPPTTPGKKRR